ncbi:alpha/beta hydrolase [Colwellia asteriadis]
MKLFHVSCSSLKTLIFVFLSILINVVFSSASMATQAFKIPRSVVVDVKDSTSEAVYPLFIKLPKNYQHSADKTYPVIYLTDAWYSFQIVSGATRYPMNSGAMEQAIIVGISYAKGSKGDSSRVLDYTPTVNSAWKKKTGGAAKYMVFLERDVISYIEKNYRAKPNDRAFVGNSLGGLLGTYILLTKPELFNHYILGSPSYWFDEHMIFKLETAFQRSKKVIEANVFIAIGERETIGLDSNYDMVGDSEKFYQQVLAWQQPKLNAKLLIIKEANHQTAFPTTVIQGLHWLYGL